MAETIRRALKFYGNAETYGPGAIHPELGDHALDLDNRGDQARNALDLFDMLQDTQLPSRQVYMAGPITGLGYEDATNGWRAEFPKLLKSHIHAFTPMRGKKHLEGLVGAITDRAEDYPEGLTTAASNIVARDHNDVMLCDAMVVNFLGAPRASIGTAVEFGWANAYRKPIIMIIEPGTSNVHNHLMLTEMAG